MTQNELGMLGLMLVAGMALGALYFAGLWQTVKRLGQAQGRARLLMVSLVVRLSVLLTVFYFLLQGGHWERLAAALAGFVLMRKILEHRLGPQKTAEAARS
ncbi:MAG TPA: ATP synthase subunit I [Smithellaceae bacterium]|nr:ATP synthase subunit I [Smithellaceae bacterium]HRS82975.1 ATP synthase subunit I [Smithellaceae bacterium]HRV43904.1 ATP synthase subunit I [Smithellaceae bacterium]